MLNLQKIKMKKNALSWEKIDDIAHVAKLLASGRAVLGSSDTVLGLMASANFLGAATLDEVKGRRDKPYIVLAKDIDHIATFVDVDPDVLHGIALCWPGPLTVIFKQNIDNVVLPNATTIAVRIPNHVGLQYLLAQIPLIYSTSANKSGQPVAFGLDGVDPDIMRQVAAVIIDEEGDGRSVASTIIDATGTQLRLVRAGAYDVMEIQRLSGLKIVV